MNIQSYLDGLIYYREVFQIPLILRIYIIISWEIYSGCNLLKTKVNSKVKRTITRVIIGTRNVVDAETSFFYRANERIDTCMSYTRPSVALSLQPIKTAFLDAKRRGVKLRYIAEITHHNFQSCKRALGSYS